ncbi:MAG: hypothetical protein APF77_24055 [Clostridia bacterium BRH_c25]|nr:MAG: hypothetical protein APF77_24055 [Clostridia bacterium BRH_c25]
MDFYKIKDSKRNPVLSIAYGLAERLFMITGGSSNGKNVDKESNEGEVKKQLRCAISGCFDKDNICCKACDIKKCRFKCNFMDKEVCEHQYWG